MGARGEGIITCDGSEFVVIYDNRTLGDIEDELRVNLIAFFQEIEVTGILPGFKETAQFLKAGMEGARRDSKSGGRPPTLLDAYDVMNRAGYGQVIQVIMTAIGNVLQFGMEEVPENGKNPNG